MMALAFVTETPTLEQRLDAWGRVLRWRARQKQAGSKEGAYRSPQHWEPPTLDKPPPSPDEARDADEIEQAVCGLSMRYHALLRAWYVHQARAESMIRIARKIGFVRPTMNEVEAAMAMGKALLVKQLELPAAVRKQRAKAWVEKNIVRAIDFGFACD